MNQKDKILKTIQIENYVWILYLILIGLSFYANYEEEKYFKYDDLRAKEKYRCLNIIIFSIALLVYLYFFYDNYKTVMERDINTSCSKAFYDDLNLLASTLILIAGAIFLYIAISDINLETEIAFN